MKQDIRLSEVARAARVSIATVSNVINDKGRVSTATERRVRRAIEQLGYAPNLLARILKTNQSRLIGLVIPTARPGRLQDNPFYWDLLAGIEEGARDRDFHIILAGIEEGDETFAFVKERQLDGLIYVGASEEGGAVERVLELGVPCVFVDSYLRDARLYQVCLDDRLGGLLATQHLLELGHRRIAVLPGDIAPERLHRNGVLQERWSGYRLALEEAGVGYDPRLFMRYPTSMEGGLQAAAWLREAGDVTAVFSFSDISAMGIVKGLRQEGLGVPADISVIGFDDLCLSGYMSPALTTVSQNIVQKGLAAIRLLVDQIEQEAGFSRKVVLPVELKVRETTGTPA
ncbi:LacI family DNA-binding transcriptional regulator [Paenibacillus sp. IB182496]|uniref:LacI family DNA-binding transcriptional regulator n=1 Tax=Paenibacillus sabuli TaxID=2772509 RepID=A0A927BUK7_9BACL|nr:LacI family DNA-binding transcriptional regulator [Paenibacillus sabuli]MBD2847108.1 LacI family DNA-binding transcriptional regulator [Paenibacillus sabuli]